MYSTVAVPDWIAVGHSDICDGQTIHGRDPMQNVAKKDCIHWGQQIYGKRQDELQIHSCHLDG